MPNINLGTSRARLNDLKSQRATILENAEKELTAGNLNEHKSLMDKAKALIPLLVPLFISAFRRADELAIAMECRCYHGGEGRTRLRQLKYRKADVAFLVCGLAVCVAVGVLGHFGL